MSFAEFVVDVEFEKICTNRSPDISAYECRERMPVEAKCAGKSFLVYLYKPFPADIQYHGNELFDVPSTAG